MAVRIIVNDDDTAAALYCSTEMEAFGPIFDNLEAAEDFLDWLPLDARTYNLGALRISYDAWHELAYDTDGHYVGRTVAS